MFGSDALKRLFGLPRDRKHNRSRGARRRLMVESLESRQLLSITLPTLDAQTVYSAASLNLPLSVTGNDGHAVTYSVALNNSSLTSSVVTNPQLTAVLPQTNPSLKIHVSYTGDTTTTADDINGDMVFQLFQDIAPTTVGKITALVNDGFYDGLTFHRILQDFMVQGGKSTVDPGTGYPFDDEFQSTMQLTTKGLLAMANAGSDTNDTEFFITAEPTRWLDFHHTVFGILTQGEDIRQKVAALPTHVSPTDTSTTPEKSIPDYTVTMSTVQMVTDDQTGVLRLSAPRGTTGTVDVAVTATDSVTHETSVKTFTVTVAADSNLDRPFLGTIPPIETTAGTAKSFYIPYTNTQANPITFDKYLDDPTATKLSVTVDSTTGYVTVTPNAGVTGVYSVLLGMKLTNPPSNESSAWDTQVVPIYISPNAPTGVSLASGYDTGSNLTDGVTDFNNTSSRKLQFTVTGTVSGTTVGVYSDGTLIGEATANGTTTTVTTNGSYTLTDGQHAITAKQTLKSQTVSVGNLHTTTDLASPATAATTITVDTVTPAFNFNPVMAAVVGVAYHCQVTTNASDGIHYALTQSPTGMSIDSNGLITWTPTSGQVPSASVTIQAADLAGNLVSKSYTITVSAVAGAPVLNPAQPKMGATGVAAPLTVSLTGTFINNGSGTTNISVLTTNGVSGGIALIGATGKGTWEYAADGTAFQALNTVSDSSALLLSKDAKLRYTPDGANSEQATITYRAWDKTAGASGDRVNLSAAGAYGGTTPYSTGTDTAKIVVDDAPVLGAYHPLLATIDENTTKTIALDGMLQASAITDADTNDTIGGIAVIGTAHNGTWQYSLDGSTFYDMGTVSPSAARLLPKTATLRYIPDSKNGETATITYRAWDATSGTAGGTTDISAASAYGGYTAFSAASDTGSITVTSLNDAPTLVSSNVSMGTTSEDATKTIALTGTFINNGSGTATIEDVDSSAVTGGIALSGTTGKGTWQYSLTGSTFQDVGTVSGSSALLLPKTASLRYIPDGSGAETPTIAYYAWDTTSGTAGDHVSLSADGAVGGTTAYSATPGSASLTVSNVNDAPVLTARSPSLGTVTEDTTKMFLLSEIVNNGATVTGVTDADTNPTLGGVALIAATGNGTWAYSTDGTNFTSVGTVSGSSALLVPAGATFRFTPDGANAGNATITYRAWDTTTGTAGSKVDTSTNGGTSAFSTTTDTATLVLTALNDAPVLAAAHPVLGSIVPTGSTTVALSSFINATGKTQVTDVDTSAVRGGIAVTGLTGKGTWKYSTDGTTFTAIGTVSDSSAMLLAKDASLRYEADGSSSEAATITYRAWDTTSGTVLTKGDTTTNGGTAAFSTTTDTATLNIGLCNLTGYVFVDPENDGLRTSGSTTNLAVPGVTVRLMSQDNQGNWTEVSGKSPVQTGSDGSYTFSNIAPGTYTIQKTASAVLADGIATAGTVSGTTTGTAGTGLIQVALAAGQSGADYNFGMSGVKPALVSLRLCLASSPTMSQLITTMHTAPTVGLGGTTAGSSYATTFNAGTAVAVADASATVTAPDSPTVASMTATLSGTLDSTSETLSAVTTNTSLTATYASSVLTVSGVADPSVYQTVLRSIKYNDTASAPTGGNRTVTVVVNDGTRTSASATSTITVGSTPSGYTITPDVSQISASEASSAGFKFAGAQIGTTYNYTISSSGGGTALSGSGSITSATQDISGINVSSLPAGTLTYSVTLTDTANRAGAAATTTATLDKTAPSGYSIAADIDKISASEATAAGFKFTGAEVGATYSYTVTNGSTTTSGSGTITSATQDVTSVNVSSLTDGTITYTVTLTDPAGNLGAAASATATLDKTTPTGYSIAADATSYDGTTSKTAGFIFTAAELGATYTYSITSSGTGATPITGTGTVGSATQHITGIDLSSLPNGTLTFSVKLTDVAGNVGSMQTATATLNKA